MNITHGGGRSQLFQIITPIRNMYYEANLRNTYFPVEPGGAGVETSVQEVRATARRAEGGTCRLCQ